MNHLYLMRHGIAIDREDPECPPEAERYLTAKGIEKTRAVAQGLRTWGVQPDGMLTSPYLRAVQTAEIVCAALGLRPAKLRRTDALLPEADPEDLFREMGGLRCKQMICFGHAPQLDLALAHALGTARTVTALKKAGVACLELSSFSSGRATLLWMAPPKMLRLAAE